MIKAYQKHRVGEGSSKYAYGDADLDVDVAITRMKCKRLKDKIMKAYTDSRLQEDTLKIIFIEILEDLGALSIKNAAKTNADKIRVMSNEELARFLVRDSCKSCQYTLDVSCFKDDCIQGHLEWLRQEVRSDDK